MVQTITASAIARSFTRRMEGIIKVKHSYRRKMQSLSLLPAIRDLQFVC